MFMNFGHHEKSLVFQMVRSVGYSLPNALVCYLYDVLCIFVVLLFGCSTGFEGPSSLESASGARSKKELRRNERLVID